MPVTDAVLVNFSFDANAPEGAIVTGEMADVSAMTGTSIDITNHFSCEGYRFTGWSLLMPVPETPEGVFTGTTYSVTQDDAELAEMFGVF